MSSDIHIRRDGLAGRITLTRPKALNALSYDMAMAMDAALKDWLSDDAVEVIIIDAEGEKAFCAGGDIQQLYDTGRAGNFGYGQRFWRDEYRLNALLADYPKPIVSFMQGFVMGGGVGIGCHVATRVVGESTQMAMPECGIGLVPDVGGSLLLARAPGRLGAYLGLTAARMRAGDAIRAGFADLFIPEDRWPSIIRGLCESGDISALLGEAHPSDSALLVHQDEIDRIFSTPLSGMIHALEHTPGPFAAAALKAMRRNSPLAMAATLELLDRLRDEGDVRAALRLEYRYTCRAMEHGDFLEGIRAQIIDRDKSPKWKHTLSGVPAAEVDSMLAPLGAEELTFEEEKS